MGDIKTSADETFREKEAPGSLVDHEPVKADIRQTFGVVDSKVTALEENASSGIIGYALWATLAAHPTGDLATGNVAKVYGPDAGTHTDPITGLTVDNEGVYSYVTGSPHGFKRIANLEAEDAVAAVQPLVDQAAADAATATAAAAEAVAASTAIRFIYEFRSLAVAEKIFFAGADAKVRQILPDPAIPALQAAAAAIPTVTVYEFRSLAYAGRSLRVGAGNAIRAIEATDQSAAIASVTAEVTAARGSKVDLATRLAVATTMEGLPLLARQGREYLRQTCYRMTAIYRALLPMRHIINMGGDSWIHGDYFVQQMTFELVAKYGDGGGGWCPFGFAPGVGTAPWTNGNQPPLKNRNSRFSVYPNKHIGNWTATYLTAPMPDLCSITSSTPGDYVEQTIPASPTHTLATQYFVGTANGVIRHSWDGGATWHAGGNINVQGTVGQGQAVTLPGIPAGPSTLRVEIVSGTVTLGGVRLDSAASGVVVNNFAATGSAVSSWEAAATEWNTLFASFGGTAFYYMDGTNSQGQARPAASWATGIGVVLDRARAATPGIDLLLAVPPENARPANAVTMTSYGVAAIPVAASRRAALILFQNSFGNPANVAADYGHAGAVPLLAADLIHPSASGARILLAAFLEMTTPFIGA